MATKKPIWNTLATPEQLNQHARNSMVERIGIEFTELGEDFLKGRMPVDSRTRQPAGLLHGGASVALAETLGSTAANLVIDRNSHYCVGLEINANHVGSCTEGFVEGVSRPIHIGKSTQIWEIRITQGERLVCVSRITLAVLDKAL